MNSKKIIAGVLTALSLWAVSGASLSISGSDDTIQPAASAASAVCTMWVKDLNDNYLMCSLTSDGTAEVLSGEVTGKTLSVPGTVSYQDTDYRITRIRSNAFRDSDVKKVDLSASYNLSYIGESAFEGSDAEEVVIGYAQDNFGKNVFRNCKSLVSADLSRSGASLISDGMFEGCESLSSVQLPNNLTGFGQYSFSGTGLEKIRISQSVTDIEYRAFFGSRLVSAEFEGSSGNHHELRLCSESFANCPELRYVVFDRANFDADTDVFTSEDRTYTINPKAVMTGNGYSGTAAAGINSYVDSVCSKLLSKWDINYDTDASEEEKMQAINELAMHLDEYMDRFKIDENGNAATVLSLRSSACGGFARTFYHCAIIMGMTDKEVLVGGDCHCHAWNYVKNDGKWYIADCGWDCIPDTDTREHVVTLEQYEYFLKNTYAFQRVLEGTRMNDPSDTTEYHDACNWYVCSCNISGASDELKYNDSAMTYLLTDYLSIFDLGTIA